MPYKNKMQHLVEDCLPSEDIGLLQPSMVDTILSDFSVPWNCENYNWLYTSYIAAIKLFSFAID